MGTRRELILLCSKVENLCLSIKSMIMAYERALEENDAKANDLKRSATLTYVDALNESNKIHELFIHLNDRAEVTEKDQQVIANITSMLQELKQRIESR